MAPARTVLFLGKAGDELVARGAAHLAVHGLRADVHLGRRGEPFPAVGDRSWDYLISYLSPWIVPAALLARARVAAINFHPGPPEYPGIGCTNFAIYEGADIYGASAHHMAEQVDAGPLIRVARFPVHETDTVWSLTQRAYAHLAVVFYDVADCLLADRPLPQSPERWTRRPFRRAELDALCRLTPDMSDEEIRRRVRATAFPSYPAASFEPAAEAAHRP